MTSWWVKRSEPWDKQQSAIPSNGAEIESSLRCCEMEAQDSTNHIWNGMTRMDKLKVCRRSGQVRFEFLFLIWLLRCFAWFAFKAKSIANPVMHLPQTVEHNPQHNGILYYHRLMSIVGPSLLPAAKFIFIAASFVAFSLSRSLFIESYSQWRKANTDLWNVFTENTENLIWVYVSHCDFNGWQQLLWQFCLSFFL